MHAFRFPSRLLLILIAALLTACVGELQTADRVFEDLDHAAYERGGIARRILAGEDVAVAVTDPTSPIYGAGVSFPAEAVPSGIREFAVIVVPLANFALDTSTYTQAGPGVEIAVLTLPEQAPVQMQQAARVALPVATSVAAGDEAILAAGHRQAAWTLLTPRVLARNPRTIGGDTESFGAFVALLDRPTGNGAEPGGMAAIPAGCFQMGDAFNEGQPDERPVHEVCLSAYRMDPREVTNADYAACVAAGGCTAPGSTNSETRTGYYADTRYAGFPVVQVTKAQASAYCVWAGKRLPTEAEWERAARGGLEGKRYPHGDTLSCDQGNYARLYGCRGYGGQEDDLAAAGSYAANGYGLYDMFGNAAEWVADAYGETYYSTSPRQDPQGPSSTGVDVTRGGSVFESATEQRVAARTPILTAGASYADVGFRCAK